MYAYFPKSKTYWAFDENLLVQAVVTLPVAEAFAGDEAERKVIVSRMAWGGAPIRGMTVELLGVEHGDSHWMIKGDVSELLDDGSALPQTFEVGRNAIIMAVARQLGWTDQQTVHASDNLLVEVGDEVVLPLRCGRCLRMPAVGGDDFYVRLTQLQYELGRWYAGDRLEPNSAEGIATFVSEVMAISGAHPG